MQKCSFVFWSRYALSSHTQVT
uniref:Uncharacterized protein n=1 Tax=Anguilla anguilla TaxID=7936 RepID=A0A0E9SK17_ANGAN